MKKIIVLICLCTSFTLIYSVPIQAEISKTVTVQGFTHGGG